MICFFNKFAFSQESYVDSKVLTLPMNKIYYDFNKFIINDHNKLTNEKSESNSINSFFNISFNTEYVANTGHPNIDNSAEFYARSSYARLFSTRVTYKNQWFSLELEPYTISQNNIVVDNESVGGTYQFNNNHGPNNVPPKTKTGFKQSRIILNYYGVGFGYGYMSHWWSPGFHSALALSSNAPSQETYAFGTFKDLRLGNFAFGAQIIVMPFTSTNDVQLYFSGLKAHVTYHSDPVITLGLHRTYMSGDFSNLSSTSKATDSWTMEDAARLVIEPLFGQSKRNLGYTIPGTPGFDSWDEILTGYIKLTFPAVNLQVYADVASDDNRGNLTDFKAHWDHTLGYMLGFKKFTYLNRWSLFTGAEYLTTRVSNTFKSSFYRGNEPPNYYAKPIYDYFTYQGRRMGAHSGSSSDDLFFLLGMGNQKNITFFSYNKERHGIKNVNFPELKTELSLTYHRKITKQQTAFITLEYEHIRNFAFVQGNVSESKLLWLGYSYSMR